MGSSVRPSLVPAGVVRRPARPFNSSDGETFTGLPRTMPAFQALSAINVVGRVSEEHGDVDAAMAAADHVFEWRFEIERSAATPLEGRAVVARFDEEDRLLLHDATQAPTGIRGARYCWRHRAPMRCWRRPSGSVTPPGCGMRSS